MKKVLAFAAVVEVVTGLGFLIVPSIVSRFLLGTELTGVSIPLARVTGIALLALGIACWPRCTPLFGMLTYNALVALYLGSLAVRGEWVGPLLWPAVVLHALLTMFLAWNCFKPQPNTSA